MRRFPVHAPSPSFCTRCASAPVAILHAIRPVLVQRPTRVLAALFFSYCPPILRSSASSSRIELTIDELRGCFLGVGCFG